MTGKVSIRGQVVIPAALRKRYNIEPNSLVEFLDTGGEIVLIPIPKDGFKKARGFLKGKGITLDDLWALRREERDREKNL